MLFVMVLLIMMISFMLLWMLIMEPPAAGPIPRVAHFVYGLWDDTPMSDLFVNTIQQWEQKGWKIKVWDKQMCEHLLVLYPEYKQLYDGFHRHVQRADLARYMIVHSEGGFYFDLDCLPVGHFSIPNKDAVFFVETVITNDFVQETASIPIREGLPELPTRIANYAFGAVVGHHSLLAVMEVVKQRTLKFPIPVAPVDYYVLFTTGPSALTRALYNLGSEPSLVIISKKKADHILKHGCTGTWRNRRDVKR